MESSDDTTLFCTSGMQQYKKLFTDKTYKNTFSNIQPCLRLNDIDEINDGNHFLYFNMIGLFSFREMTVEETINFWMEFLDLLNIKPDYVTVHPDKSSWSKFHTVPVRFQDDCIWTDGKQTGYCTEFFIDDIEIGNIVNPGGDCIDVGFGLERLCLMLGDKPSTELEILESTIMMVIQSGFKPGPKRQEYSLRKLIRLFIRQGGKNNHPFIMDEMERLIKMRKRYEKMKHNHKDKSSEWWWNTHGIDIFAIG